jgi:hypothetical protein
MELIKLLGRVVRSHVGGHRRTRCPFARTNRMDQPSSIQWYLLSIDSALHPILSRKGSPQCRDVGLNDIEDDWYVCNGFRQGDDKTTDACLDVVAETKARCGGLQ